MRKTTLFATMLAFALAHTSANAENWDGGFAGIGGGYVDAEIEGTANSILALPIVAPATDRFDGNGASIGAIAGYRFELGSAVLGAEVDADWSSTKADHSTPAASNSSKIKWQGTARLTAGLSAGKVLFYTTVGAAIANMKHRANFGLGAPQFRWSESPIGWVVGGGVELSTGKIRPRLEYRHTDFGGTVSDVNASVIFRRKVRSDSIRLSLISRF